VLRELQAATRRFSPLPLAAQKLFQVQSPTDLTRVQELLEELQLGEAEAIALALELQSEILIDEADGREIAMRLGLSLVGALGILVRFKQNGLISSVLPLIARLENELRFFVSDKLRNEIARIAGE